MNKRKYIIHARIGATTIYKDFNTYDDWVSFCEHLVQEINYLSSNARVFIWDYSKFDRKLVYDAEYGIVNGEIVPLCIFEDYKGFSTKMALNECHAICFYDVISSLFGIYRFIHSED